jgi:alginate O-acetyltransferase complex protein AlgI
MLFNSIDFAIFLPIVFLLYWFVFNKNLRIQNLLILVSSYVFYGWWDWRFLFLIAFSSILDYLVGLGLMDQNDPSKRKFLLWTSIIINIGLLGFFKYYNFFIDSFVDSFAFFGRTIEARTLDIILPVGISFYTFQTLSYTIDVYKRKLEPTKDFIGFSSFVSFFPQLVAGPIERASNLLPQILKPRTFQYSSAVDGMRQIIWGLFKKAVIADRAALYVNDVFNTSSDYTGSTYLIGTLFFTFQVYCDFSGYSDIAIGTSKLFGFNLMRNFAYPFFSRDISELWRRWHISLTTWFRDYIYFPLGGNKFGVKKTILNTFIVFTVSGVWHGANWTFVLFGFLSAVYFVPSILSKKTKTMTKTVAEGRFFPTFTELYQMIITFSMFSFSLILFRSESIGHSMRMYKEVFSGSLFTVPHVTGKAIVSMIFISFLVLMEWIGRENQHALEKTATKWKRPYRWALYFIIVTMIIGLGVKQQNFIYFQF